MLSPNKQFVLSSYRHGRLLLVAGGKEGAELWLTTYCVKVDLLLLLLLLLLKEIGNARLGKSD